MQIPGMTIRDLMNTDCLDVDDVLLVSATKHTKKKKEIRPLTELVDTLKKGGS